MQAAWKTAGQMVVGAAQATLTLAHTAGLAIKGAARITEELGHAVGDVAGGIGDATDQVIKSPARRTIRTSSEVAFV